MTLQPSSTPKPHCSGALELVGAVSAGLASSAGVVHTAQPRRDGRLMLAVAEAGEAASAHPGPNGVPPPVTVAVVVGAARLMQHPALLAHPIPGFAGMGRYQAHSPLLAATILQGAEGLRSAHFARGFALQQPMLLVSEAAAVLFSSGGLEAVLVLPLAATGGLHLGWGGACLMCKRWCLATCTVILTIASTSMPAFPLGSSGVCRDRGAVCQPRDQPLLKGGRPSGAARRGGGSGGSVPAQPRDVAAPGAPAAAAEIVNLAR